ncbi:L,D-transpeptidase [Kaistella palustris]|uniref:L,D-transpeptidase n=1 Tax=Kaistella palustris TaxID=493376 RepID=UPI00054E36D0|nr:L,D-transpeptidase [Kaistella palustris]
MKKFSVLKLSFAFISLTVILQCKKDEVQSQQDAQIQARKDSVSAAKKDSAVQAELEKQKVTYTPFVFPKKKKDSATTAFNKNYTAAQRAVILALNRLDTKNKWRADTLAVPDKFDETLAIYAPFPRNVDMLKDVHKIAFFSYPVQAYALYEQGKLVKWGPTSLGKKSAQTKRGLMFANWKKELAISTVDSDWKLPYNFNIHNSLGIGWHEYDLPGFPASHSCLRLLQDDAKFLYNWADQWTLNKGGATVKANGTPVIVYGDYPWGGRKPWLNLLKDSKANDIALPEFEQIIKPHLDKILEEQAKTDKVKSQLASSETSENPAA